jgi:four helix bundle protein
MAQPTNRWSIPMSIVCKSQDACEPSPQQLSDRLIDFAVRIGRIADALPDTRLGRHIAGQLIASGTSPAPNYNEACAAESRRDFVHKLGICLKELRESLCWLKMITRSKMFPEPKLDAVRNECEQLANIIGKSIVTAKRRSMTR